MINSVTVTGNLTRDPEFKATRSGMPVIEFSLAVNERVKQNEEWTDRPNYFDCVAFGTGKEKLLKYANKGTQLTVQGHLKQERWEAQDGGKRSKVVVIADEVALPPKGASAPQAQYVEANVYDEDIPF